VRPGKAALSPIFLPIFYGGAILESLAYWRIALSHLRSTMTGKPCLLAKIPIWD